MKGPRPFVSMLPGVVVALAVQACDTAELDSDQPRVDSTHQSATVASKSPPPAPPALAGLRQVSPSELAQPKVRGFRHSLAKSRCSLRGVAERQVFENGDLVRHVGPGGTFAETANGLASFSVPATRERELTVFQGTSEEHQAHVKAYFLGAGLPADQLDFIHTGTLMMESGVVTDKMPAVPKLLGRMAVLRRQIDGVSVAESFAWARFDAAQEVVGEQVWWPEVSITSTSEAAAFRSVIDNPTLNADFRSKLPPEVRGEGKLAIHHSLPLGERWEEHVTWDVRIGNGLRSFDRFGKEVRLRP